MFMIYGKSVEMLVEFLWKFYSKYGYFCEDIWKTKISKWKHCISNWRIKHAYIHTTLELDAACVTIDHQRSSQ